jgi:hypothetical protein
LRAELHTPDRDLPWPVKEPLGLMAYPDQIGQDWRHFEWTFRIPLDIDANTIFRIYTQSERLIEVRNVEFRESHWERARVYPNHPGTHGADLHLYFLLAELAPCKPGDPPVAVYENIGFPWLWYGRSFAHFNPIPSMRAPPKGSQELEGVKWDVHIPAALALNELPPVGIKVECHPTLMLMGTAAGGIFYLIVLAAVGFAAAARRRE